MTVPTYRQAGVDLEGAERHVERIGPLVTATWGPNVVGGFGGFAAGVALPDGYRRPVLMMSTDGVGTKLELARATGRWAGVGFDLVAMCVDDLAAAGARPLGFVDYLAVGALDPVRDATIVASIAEACAAAGCPLLGGETAEHPGVMDPDQVDLAGAALGVVEQGEELGRAGVREGDLILGIRSPNLRSNGFSLVRAVFAGEPLDATSPVDPEAQLGESLLEPSVIYAPAVLAAVAGGGVRAAAHITGGGIPGNLVRALPDGLRAVVDRSTWEEPLVFRAIRDRGVTEAAMVETFNLGIGFCLVVAPEAADDATAAVADHGHDARVVGWVVAGEQGVDLV
jgi:phosphoribosylformylglycinamidine cyclo-ligase